jgi:HSP20 family molecular chaperone IbpA
MRCYRGALEGASTEDLEISANDNWLLIELKQAKQKEKKYAKVSHE